MILAYMWQESAETQACGDHLLVPQRWHGGLLAMLRHARQHTHSEAPRETSLASS
eukprot:COSAG06_NODE_4128_length_4540_cov_14.432785_6_plen_55_part_00